MWGRTSLSLAVKLTSRNHRSDLFNLPSCFPKSDYHGTLARCNSATTGSTSAADPVNLAQSGSNVPYVGPRAASAIAFDLPSLASGPMVKAKEVMQLAQHYGQCYWELSKARLSMLVVATSGVVFVMGSGSAIDYLGLGCTCAGTMMVAASANSLNQWILLTVATSGAGFVMGSGSSIDYLGLGCTCAGTMMVAASANSLNQVFEVKNDANMNRTKRRPLPSGRITVPHAVAWASSAGLAGTALLVCQLALQRQSRALCICYTPLKQIHPVNTWVGAMVGAIPPLLGWAAACGQISVTEMILPAALYFWQIPHFMALAYLCRKDYADGGFKMFSLADPSGHRTALVALRNCLYQLPLGYLAYNWGITSGWFCAESTLLALAISFTATSFYLKRTTQSARRMFHASLLCLPVFMSGLVVHRVSNDKQSVNVKRPDKFIHPPYIETDGVLNEETIPNEVRKPRPPVAYALVAPFPFLPAPSYASS